MGKKPVPIPTLSTYLKGFYPVITQSLETHAFPALARTLYAWRRRSLNLLPHFDRFKEWIRPDPKAVKLVCISDTHNARPILPPGDILIHAGDLSQGGHAFEIQRNLDWLNAQPHQHKIVIAGNHDLFLDKDLRWSSQKNTQLRWGSIIYLENTATTLTLANGRTLQIYGSPNVVSDGRYAFTYQWQDTDVFTEKIPSDLDILITHTPCMSHLDGGTDTGDPSLLRELWRVKPKIHVCGHIHHGHGQDLLYYDVFQERYETFCQGEGTIGGLRSMLTGWSLRPRGQTSRLVNASIERKRRGIFEYLPERYQKLRKPQTLII